MLPVLSPWIHTTYSCNLSCPYCHVKQKTKHMSAKTFVAICERLAYLMDHGFVERANLRISGGEPLLRFKHYAGQLRSFMDRHYDKVHVEFLTNLTFMPPGFMEFCLDKFGRLGLSVSLDSLLFSKPMKSRGAMISSDHLVRNNLALFPGELLSSHVGISTVATDSGDHLGLLARYVADKKFASWNVELDKLDVPKNVVKLKKNVTSMVSELVKGGYPLFRVGFENVTIGRTDNCDCGAGGRLIAIDTNGDVYPCQTLLGQKKYRLSAIREFYPEQAQTKRRSADCGQCPIAKMCGGGCRFHNKGLRRKRICEVLKHYVLEAGTTCIEKQASGWSGAQRTRGS